MISIGGFEDVWRTLEYGDLAAAKKLLGDSKVQDALLVGLDIYKVLYGQTIFQVTLGFY